MRSNPWFSKRPARRSRRPLGCEALERRALLAADFPQLIDPNPSPGNQFGDSVVPLSTGNVVVTSPFDDAGGTDAGAVYLFNGATGALISTLTGSTDNERVGLGLGFGAVTPLSNGNFVVCTPNWDNVGAPDAGAVTWGSGRTGVSGIVGAANSLVGSTANDQVGIFGATALTNGNYVVGSLFWDNGAANDAGAATFASGTSRSTGVVGPANSLVGVTASDQVGSFITALTNGNYVVGSPQWDNGPLIDAGASTFGNGVINGAVGAANSLVGSAIGDRIGGNVTALANGNYVVQSPFWHNGALPDAGAATFASGVTGISGPIVVATSLIGSSANDQVGSDVTELANGNYVVSMSSWDNGGTTNVGAATFGTGASGVSGVVSSSNSLVGSTAGDFVGGVNALANGNYVVSSPNWDNGPVANVGAATLGDGTSGTSGLVSSGNSLVGGTADDFIGRVTALTNGNYVVSSQNWDNGPGAINAGAATFVSGTSGLIGVVSSANSLVGSTADDRVSGGGVFALANGNYVVSSYSWDNGAAVDAGAATWGNGTTGISGAIDAVNSLLGGTTGDIVGIDGITVLASGNYVVTSSNWDNGAVVNAGAATFGNGTSGTQGIVSNANSLVGRTENDAVGGGGVTALSNGAYVVSSPFWDKGAVANAGAVTFGNLTSGIRGSVSGANSLVGSTINDIVGFRDINSRGSVIALSNGNYVVRSPFWDNGELEEAGAMTFGSGKTGVKGTINSFNSAIGEAANTDLQFPVLDNENETFFARFFAEAGGIVRVGSQIDGFNAPPVIGAFGVDRTYTENGNPVLITPIAMVSDADSANFAGGQLRVSFISGGVSSDRFAIRSQGTGPGQINVQGNQVRFGTLVLGTFTGGVGGPLVVTFTTGAASPARVQALLRNVTFRNVSDNPPGAARTVRVFLSDGDGESVASRKQITITRRNDAPELAPESGATVGYTRGAAPAALLASARVIDPDSPNFAGGKLLMRAIQGAHASNRLLIFGGFTLSGNNLQFEGETIGTRNDNGGEGLTRLEITFNQNATVAIVQRLARSVRFRTAGLSPPTQRVFELFVTDGDGGASNRVNVAVNVT